VTGTSIIYVRILAHLIHNLLIHKPTHHRCLIMSCHLTGKKYQPAKSVP
jgi:hypothetical protein